VGGWGTILLQVLTPLVFAGLVFAVSRMGRVKPLTLVVGLAVALVLADLRLGLNFALQAQITETFDSPLSWQAGAWFIAWLAYANAMLVAGAWLGWRSRPLPFSRQTVEGDAYSAAIDSAAGLDEAMPVLERLSQRHPDELPLTHDALVRLAARDPGLQAAGFKQLVQRLTADSGISPEAAAYVAGALVPSAKSRTDSGVA
jgi:hypothetical protein